MKNLKNKNIVITAAVIVALGVVGSYWGYSKVNKARTDAQVQMEQIMAKLQTQLPEGFSQKNTILEQNSGLFHTTGLYTLSYIDPADKSFTFDYDISYDISHGFSSYSTKHYPIKGKAVLKSEKLNKYNLNNYTSIINGSIEQDTFSMEFKNDPINIIIDETSSDNLSVIKITAPSSTSNVVYNKEKNTINLNYIYPNINVKNEEKDESYTFNIKNLQVLHDGNIDNLTLDNSLLEIDIDEINDNEQSLIKGVNIKSQIQNNENSYHFINNVIANSIVHKDLPDEEISFALSTSINNVNKQSINQIINIYKSLDENNLTATEEEELAIKNNVLTILQDGFDININKFLFMSKELTAEGNAEFSLHQAKSPVDISIANNSTLKANMKINSKNPTYISYLNNTDLLGYKHPKTTEDTYYFDVSFSKDKFIYNLTDITGTQQHSGLLFTLKFLDQAIKANLR